MQIISFSRIVGFLIALLVSYLKWQHRAVYWSNLFTLTLCTFARLIKKLLTNFFKSIFIFFSFDSIDGIIWYINLSRHNVTEILDTVPTHLTIGIMSGGKFAQILNRPFRSPSLSVWSFLIIVLYSRRLNLPAVRSTVCTGSVNLNPSYAVQTACCQPHHKNNPKFARRKEEAGKKKGQSTTSTTAKRDSCERGQCDKSADRRGARPAGRLTWPRPPALLFTFGSGCCLPRGDNLTVR